MGSKSVILVIGGRYGAGVACIFNKNPLNNCRIDELEVELELELQVERGSKLEGGGDDAARRSNSF